MPPDYETLDDYIHLKTIIYRQKDIYIILYNGEKSDLSALGRTSYDGV
jgi:hypothetical protein